MKLADLFRAGRRYIFDAGDAEIAVIVQRVAGDTEVCRIVLDLELTDAMLAGKPPREEIETFALDRIAELAKSWLNEDDEPEDDEPEDDEPEDDEPEDDEPEDDEPEDDEPEDEEE